MSNEEPESEQPWNEEQWEKFFKESDVRSAKFGELLETFHDHPDRDAIIDREMGWDRDDDGEPFEWDEQGPDFDDEEDDDDEAETFSTNSDDENPFGTDADDDEDDDSDIWEDRDLKRTPYYTKAFQFGLNVHDQLKPYLVEDDENQDEDFIDALANGFTIAAKLAGAHGMGTDDDVLCGNIVCCKRSLEAASECLRALSSLRERGLLPGEIADPLVTEGAEVRGLVEQHIAELRSKVWWQ
jgi:hypothetical protein